MIHNMQKLSESGVHQQLPNGKWAPSRPVSLGGIPAFLSRIKAAWMVLVGRADALVWPHQEKRQRID